MGFIRNVIRTLTPTRNYQSFETEKIKTSKFTVIRRKRKTSSIGKVLASISFCIAILCIFEAAVWFSTGFPEPENNKLRISYLETRISLHQPTTIENPFDIINTSIIALLLIDLQLLNHFYHTRTQKYQKYKYLTDKSLNKLQNNNHINTQSLSDWIVLQFLSIFSKPKKTAKWIQ